MIDAKTRFQKVMLVDDNAIDLYITTKIIKKNKFAETINHFTSALSALEFLKENETNFTVLPQIVFVDIYMPLMSGFEFMEEYDKLSSDLKNHCKVYIISSSIDENDIKKANEDPNIVAFQVKTITTEFLNSIL